MPKRPDFVNQIIKRSNYMAALLMLCTKMGWMKEYSGYVLGKDVDATPDERKEFYRKATRLLAVNYDGIHTGENPALSPRLLPECNPLSQPLRFPKEWNEERK